MYGQRSDSPVLVVISEASEAMPPKALRRSTILLTKPSGTVKPPSTPEPAMVCANCSMSRELPVRMYWLNASV